MIKDIWALALTGVYTPRRIMEIANHEWGLRTIKRKRSGGKVLSLSGVYRILSNQFYAGVLQRGGKTYPGKHPPMITLREFDHVQEILGRPNNPRPQTRQFAFTGLIKCGSCGLSVTAEVRTQRHGHRYTYYHCTKRRIDQWCQEPYVQSKELEQQIVEFLNEISIPERFHKWAIERLKHAAAGQKETAETRRKSVEVARSMVDKQMANLTRLRINDLLSDAEFISQRAELERERISLAQAATELGSSGQWFEPARDLISFSNSAVSWFQNGDSVAKRLIVTIVGSNLVLKSQKLSIGARKPFRQWGKTPNNSEWSRFVKDVRTQEAKGELMDTLKSIKKLTDHIKETEEAAWYEERAA